MKANGVPEKIYLVKDRDTNKPMDYWYSATTDDSRTEYTRTDAFIKKAIFYIQQHWIWNTKMIEGFKNYVKGE